VTGLLLFDEGPGAGLGHRRRMEALACELERRGRDFELRPLGAADHGGAAVAGSAVDLLVIDSYRQRADDPELGGAPVVAAVDDLARDLAVDLLIDPSPGAVATPHRRARRVLAGASYALVPPADPALPATPPDAPVSRVLVTTGAADAAGVGAQIAHELAARVPAGAEVRLVVGPWGDGTVPDGVVAVRTPDGLAAELALASIVVTAGGVTLLEACRLGRPVVALALADNQRQAVQGLERVRAVVAATPETAADAVHRLAGDPVRRAVFAAAARTAVDGRGAARVVDVLEQLAGCPADAGSARR